MIYCVVPKELADELYEKLSSYYSDDPNVEVIVDRREAERRSGGGTTDGGEARQVRDRRRQRVPGEFPKLDSGDS